MQSADLDSSADDESECKETEACQSWKETSESREEKGEDEELEEPSIQREGVGVLVKALSVIFVEIEIIVD